MKKHLILILALLVSFSSYSQFGIENKIRSKWEKKGKEHAEKQLDKAEEKGMEEAEKGLDKAYDAAEPGMDTLDNYEEEGEKYAIYGIGKYNDFVSDYEASVESKDPEDYRRYGFESAIVEYELSGSEDGTKTMYIDMGGFKTAEHKTIKHRKDETTTATIMIGSDMISVDYESESAVKIHNPMAFLLANPDTDWEEAGERVLTGMGYEIIGSEKIAGKECDIWKQGSHRIWVWRGLTLKSKIGKQEETATSVEIDVNVPESIFQVPEGFEYEDYDSGDMLPEMSDEDLYGDDYSDEDMDELLDEIENMTYSEYKAKCLLEEPGTDEETIRQSWLYLRQEAKRRNK